MIDFEADNRRAGWIKVQSTTVKGVREFQSGSKRHGQGRLYARGSTAPLALSKKR